MADKPIAAVYSSQLLRANDTGKAIAGHHDLEVEVIEELEEIRLFEGMPQDQRPSDLLGEKALATAWSTCSIGLRGLRCDGGLRHDSSTR